MKKYFPFFEILKLYFIFDSIKIMHNINFSCWCLGIDTKFKGQHYPIMIAVSHVPELQQITQEDDGIRVGAAVTLDALKGALEKVITEQPGTIEI